MKQASPAALAAILLAAMLPIQAATARAQDQDLPGPLREVAFEQRLGEQLPLDAVFRDESGATVSLGSLLGRRPAVLALVYYECPMICTMVLNGLTHTLRTLDFTVGDEFDVVVLSFDPKEGPKLAAAKKSSYLEEYGHPESAAGWHFLTGDEDQIRSVTDAVGFRYVYDEESGEYAHATGLTVLTASGRIARTLYGIEYAPKDLRLALVEAGEEKIGNVVDQILLYCFRYDPTTGRYGAVVINIIRLVGVLTVGGIVAFWLAMWLHGRRSRRPVAPGAA